MTQSRYNNAEFVSAMRRSAAMFDYAANADSSAVDSAIQAEIDKINRVISEFRRLISYALSGAQSAYNDRSLQNMNDDVDAVLKSKLTDASKRLTGLQESVVEQMRIVDELNLSAFQVVVAAVVAQSRLSASDTDLSPQVFASDAVLEAVSDTIREKFDAILSEELFNQVDASLDAFKSITTDSIVEELDFLPSHITTSLIDEFVDTIDRNVIAILRESRTHITGLDGQIKESAQAITTAIIDSLNDA